MIVVLLGPPGAGKGTQADFIAASLNIPKLSTGDMLRAAVASGSSLGQEVQQIMQQGKLVSDAVMVDLIRHRIHLLDCRQGFILDGFPRTLPQAQALTDMFAEEKLVLDSVIELKVDEAALVERISGRFACATCAAGYHDRFHPTAVSGVCDQCGGTNFTRRPDDVAETVVKRLQAYNAQTAPLLPYYQQQGILVSVDGMQPIEQVKQQVEGALKVGVKPGANVLTSV